MSAVLCLLSLRPVPLAVWAASVLLAVAVLSVVLCLLALLPALRLVCGSAASVSVALMVLHVCRCGSFGDNVRRLCLLAAVLLARCVRLFGHVLR